MGNDTKKSAPVMDASAVRAEFAKLQAKRAASKARRQTPEFKVAQKARNAAKAAQRRLVLAEAAKLGLKLS
jgi:hypothetical protein